VSVEAALAESKAAALEAEEKAAFLVKRSLMAAGAAEVGEAFEGHTAWAEPAAGSGTDWVKKVLGVLGVTVVSDGAKGVADLNAARLALTMSAERSAGPAAVGLRAMARF
jgi:hypothetical protein